MRNSSFVVLGAAAGAALTFFVAQPRPAMTEAIAKVSGEMVSLIAVEDALAGAFPQYGLRCQIAVITRPDENNCSVLLAVSNEPKLTLDEVRDAIQAKGLTNLSVPREIKTVKEIPKLGTGKVDHRGLKTMMEKAEKSSATTGK
mgnify:CR=1 FL=1